MRDIDIVCDSYNISCCSCYSYIVFDSRIVHHVIDFIVDPLIVHDSFVFDTRVSLSFLIGSHVILNSMT